MSKKDIACLLLKLKACSVKLGYAIVLREPKGYDVSEFEAKLAYVNVLRSMIENYGCACNKKIIKGYIQICGGKVLPSKNNPLLLAQSDKNCLTKTQIADQYCIDLCEVEAKLGSICINC